MSDTRNFSPILEWEGYVESIGDKDFVVRMANIKTEEMLPADMATFSKDDLSDSDKKTAAGRRDCALGDRAGAVAGRSAATGVGTVFQTATRA